MQYPVIGIFGPGDGDSVGTGVSRKSILPSEFAYFLVSSKLGELHEADPRTVRAYWGNEPVTVVDMRARSVSLRVEVKGTVYQFEGTAKVVDGERVARLEISDLNSAISAYIHEFEYALALILEDQSVADGAAIIAGILEAELPRAFGMLVILDAQPSSTRVDDDEGPRLSPFDLRNIVASFRGMTVSIGQMAEMIASAGTDRLHGVSGAVWVSGADGREVRDALIGLFENLDIGDVDLGPEIHGSWFQHFNLRLRAFMTQPDMVKIADEAKQRLDIELVDFRRAQLEALRVDTAARLLASLENQREAVAMMGTLIIIKFGNQVIIRIVDALTAARIEGNNKLLSNPRAVLQILDGDLETPPRRRDGRGEIS